MSSTKLRAIINQVKKILEENDVAGILILHESAINGSSQDKTSYSFTSNNGSLIHLKTSETLFKHRPDGGASIHLHPAMKDISTKMAKTGTILGELTKMTGEVFDNIKAANDHFTDFTGVMLFKF